MADKNMNAEINVEFEESASRQQLNSGEDVNTLFGKIKKFFADLKAVAFSGNYSDLDGTPDLSQYAKRSIYGDTAINLGRKSGTDVGEGSTAEGHDTTASAYYCHAEGEGTQAIGNYSHAEGYYTKAETAYDHAEGLSTIASGGGSHAEGFGCKANSQASHAEGYHTYTSNWGEHACGQYNVSTYSETLMSVGDGTSEENRHNAFEITKNGGNLHDKKIAVVNDIPNPNLLINPDFKINQRGTMGTVGTTGYTGYTVDGWFMAKHTSVTNSGNYQVLTNGIELTTNGTRLSTYFRQRFENADNLSGKTVTLSFKVETPNANDWLVGQYGATHSALNIDANGIGHVTFVWDGDQSYQAIQFYNNVANTTLKIYWVKLEVGSNATPFVPPEYSAELLKCQRYYQIRSENNIAAVDLRPNMRSGVVPTITALADGNYSYSTEL